MIQETFALDPLPPFRLDLTVWALRRRDSNLIDRWDGTTYTRILTLDGQAVKVAVIQQGAPESPRLLVTASCANPLPCLTDRAATLLRCMLGCTVDLTAFYTLARRDSHITALAQRFQGLKPPRFPTLFEVLLNAFACQQVSLEVGLLLLNRLTETYGLALVDEQGDQQRAFPQPEAFAGVTSDDLRPLGLSRQKARALLELAALLARDPQDMLWLETLSSTEISQRLLLLRGVGRWTAEYTLLRGFGRIDIFPGDDVGAQKNLQTLLALDEKPTYEQIKTLTARWHPYAGLIYFHLLLEKLAQRGFIQI